MLVVMFSCRDTELNKRDFSKLAKMLVHDLLIISNITNFNLD